MASTAEQQVNRLIAQVYDLFDDKIAIAIVKAAAEKVGLAGVEFVMNEYPPEPPGPGDPSPIVTKRQHRWWWANMNAIAKGESFSPSLRGWKAVYKTVNHRKTLVLSGGYTRTGTLVRSITHQVEPQGVGAIVRIGPSMARHTDKEGGYAKYVIGDPPAPIHRRRWKPLVRIVASKKEDLLQLFYTEAMKQARAYFRKNIHSGGL